jgi:hypothetical protein
MGLLSTLEVKVLDRNIALDLSLDERGGHAKFGCIGSYRVQMHKEQTNNRHECLLRVLTTFLIDFTLNVLFFRYT